MNPSPFPSTPTENYNYFLKADTSGYKGEWIAIVGKKIVAHGKDAQKVYEKAQRKYPEGRISLAKAPNEQMMGSSSDYHAGAVVWKKSAGFAGVSQ